MVQDGPESRPEDNSGVLMWTVHPLFDNRRRSLYLLGVLFMVLALVRLNYPEPIWTVFAAIVLTASLLRYFFPTHYRLTSQGVEMVFLGVKKHLPWAKFRSWSIGRTGILLSPFPGPHRLENFRGYYLLFGPNREEVIEYVQSHIQPVSEGVGKD